MLRCLKLSFQCYWKHHWGSNFSFPETTEVELLFAGLLVWNNSFLHLKKKKSVIIYALRNTWWHTVQTVLSYNLFYISLKRHLKGTFLFWQEAAGLGSDEFTTYHLGTSVCCITSHVKILSINVNGPLSLGKKWKSKQRTSLSFFWLASGICKSSFFAGTLPAPSVWCGSIEKCPPSVVVFSSQFFFYTAVKIN